MKLMTKAAAIFVIAFGLGVLSATFLPVELLITLFSCLVILTGLLIIRS